MELTKEYFDQVVKGLARKDDLKSFATKEDLISFATKDDLKSFSTKDDLKSFATKDDLRKLAERLEGYTDSVAETILEAVSHGFNGTNRRLDNLSRRLGHVELDFGEMKKALHIQ